MSRPELQQHWVAFCNNPGEASFAGLYEGTRNFLFTICMRVVGDEEEALDILQTVYSELLLVAQSGNPDVTSMDVDDLARRLALRHADTRRKRFVRQGSRFVPVDDIDSLPPDQSRSSPRDQAANSEIRSMVAEAVQSLPDNLRVPLMMHYEQGMTHQQIADAMGVSRGYITRQIGSGAGILEGVLRRQGITQPIMVLVGLLGGASALMAPSQVSAAALWSDMSARVAATGNGASLSEAVRSNGIQTPVEPAHPAHFASSGVKSALPKAIAAVALLAAIAGLIIYQQIEDRRSVARASLVSASAAFDPDAARAPGRVTALSQDVRVADPALPIADALLGLGAIRGYVVSKHDSSPVANVALSIPALQDPAGSSSLYLRSHAVSGAEGKFEFSRLPVGKYAVFTKSDGKWASTERDATVTSGNVTELGEVAINALGSIELSVVAEPDMAAVAGHAVVLTDLLSSTAQELRTDREGKLVIRDLAHYAYAIHMNRDSYHYGINLESEPHRNLTIVLGQATVAGRVTGGTPGVRVDVSLSRVIGHDIEMHEQKLAGAGGFELRNIPRGVYLVEVIPQRKDLRNQKLSRYVTVGDAPIQDLDFHVPSGVVVGKLPAQSYGQPVRVCAGRVSSFGPDAIPPASQAMSAADGTFRIEGCPPGEYTVSALLPGNVLAVASRVNVPADGDTAPAELRVLPESESAGIRSSALAFESELGIQAAWCDLIGPAGRTCVTDGRTSDGELMLSGLAPGKYSMIVSAYGHTAAAHEFTLTPGEPKSFTDVLDGAGALIWMVYRNDGKDLTDAQCSLAPLDSQSRALARQGKVDADGNWIIRGILPGKYELAVTAGDLSSSQTVFVDARMNVAKHTELKARR